jgi:hypothetical protein
MRDSSIPSDTLSHRWHQRFSTAVRLVIAPLLLFWSGFATSDFLMSGVYTWPRSSRILVLTLTVCVLAYEFVYQEQPDEAASLKAVLSSCLIPYIAGVLALLVLAAMAS